MSIVKQTGYNLIGSIVPLAVSLITVPLYLSVIGLERYGVLALCLTLLGYMGFFNLGLGPSVAQMMAKLRSASGSERARIFWTALWISLAMGLAAGLLVYRAADFYFSRMESLPTGLLGEIADAKFWLAAIIPLMLPCSVLTGALQGHERFLSINAIASSTSILMSVAPLLVAYVFGPSLWGLLAAALGARAVSLIASFVVCRRSVALRSVHLPDWHLARNLMHFGGWITVDNLIGEILLTFDRFVIGVMLGARAVSVYTVPFTLVSAIQIVPTALSTVLFPRFAATPVTEDADRLEIESIAALAVVMTPICVASMAAVGPFLVLWIGSDLAVQSTPVACLILFALCPNSAARVPYARMLGKGRPDLIAKIHLVEIPPYLGLLFYGVSHYGVVGAAMAWSARTVADAAVFAAFAVRRKEAFERFAIPSLLTSAALAAVLLLPMESVLRWLSLAILVIAALAWSYRNAPDALRTRAAAAWVRVTLFNAPAGLAVDSGTIPAGTLSSPSSERDV